MSRRMQSAALVSALWLAPVHAQGDADSAEGLLRATRHIAEKVAALRGQPFERPVVAVRVPDDLRLAGAEIRAYSIVGKEQLRARGRAWGDLGMGGSRSPEKLVTSLCRDLDGIGFDPTENRVLVTPDRLTARDYTPQAEVDGPSAILMATGVRRDEPLVAHMLMHLRQRERSDRDFLAETTDGLLARAALAEGEANLLAVRYLFEGMGLQDDVIRISLSPGEYLDGALVPRDLDTMIGAEADLLRFVYVEGFARAVELFQAGGWARVDKAVRSGGTTRDVLHPDRGRLTPATFAEPEAPAPGLELVDRDSLGEQGTIVLVSRVTGKDNLALQVGDGWAGDRLLRWEGDGDAAATEWTAHWASLEDVEDFLWGWNKMIKARFLDAVPQDEDGVQTVTTPERTFRMEHTAKRTRVLVLSGAARRGGAAGATRAAQ